MSIYVRINSPVSILFHFKLLHLLLVFILTFRIISMRTYMNVVISIHCVMCIKLPSHIPRDLTASLLRPCYDPGRSTVAMDPAGTQRGRSEEPKDAQGRRPSANILNMHKTVAETLHSC